MKWPKALQKSVIDCLTIEERGILLTNVANVMAGLDIEENLPSGVALALMMLESEVKASQRNAANGKNGGNPALQKAKQTVPKAEPVASPSQPRKKQDKTPESIVADYQCGEELRSALREFIALRTRLRKPLTAHAMELQLSALERLASTEETRLAVVNQSIMNGWQSFYELKSSGSKGSGQGRYGPNGVELVPEAERRTDLDDILF